METQVSTNLKQEEYLQIIDWIHGTRQGHKNAAWFVNSVRHGKTITKSQRGEFDGDIWQPFEEERRECCDQIDKPTDDNPYTLIEHCRTHEHIENLIATLTNREIRKEMTRMIRATADVISNFGNI